MLDQLFTSTPSDPAYGQIRPRKGVIIGMGQVGLACAYSMLIQDCFDELVLQDIAVEKLEGEVMDLVHGMPFLPPTDVKAGTVADVGRGADLVIITAGAAQKPGESRLNLVERNVAIFRSILADVVRHCPDAILLIVSNPVDIMTYVTLKLTGFPPARVIGSGTVLDTARFRYLLAQKLGIDARSVHAHIIGEHGDSELPVWSTANVAGVKLFPDGAIASSLSPSDIETPGIVNNPASLDQAALARIFEQVRGAAYEIIKRKGSTSYAIGLSVTDVVKAILRSQERVLTVSSLIDGLYDIHDVCLGLPRVVNERGILKTVKLPLSDSERQQLQASAQVVRQIIDQLSL